MKIAYMKKVWVTSWSQSQGWPIVRVTMSNTTVLEKAKSRTPHNTISASSSLSKARHFKWRWRFNTNLSTICTPLLDGADQVLDLDRVGPQLLGQAIEVGRRRLREARLVDVGDQLDADRLQLVGRLMLELERLRGLGASDLVGGRRDPFLLVDAQALPQLVADPDEVVVGLVLGHRQDRRHFVVLG